MQRSLSLSSYLVIISPLLVLRLSVNSNVLSFFFFSLPKRKLWGKQQNSSVFVLTGRRHFFHFFSFGLLKAISRERTVPLFPQSCHVCLLDEEIFSLFFFRGLFSEKSNFFFLVENCRDANKDIISSEIPHYISFESHERETKTNTLTSCRCERRTFVCCWTSSSVFSRVLAAFCFLLLLLFK